MPIILERGSHLTREDGMCVMEAVAYVAGEPHSDEPACASYALTSMAIWINDLMPDDVRSEYLSPYIPRLIGTRAPNIDHLRLERGVRYTTNLLGEHMFEKGFGEEGNRLIELAQIGTLGNIWDYAHLLENRGDLRCEEYFPSLQYIAEGLLDPEGAITMPLSDVLFEQGKDHTDWAKLVGVLEAMLEC